MIDYNKRKPELGVEVIGFNKNWIHEDFNPKGFRIGHRDDENDFISAHYWDYQDTYICISHFDCDDKPEYSDEIKNNIEPTHWFPILNPEVLIKTFAENIKHGDEEHQTWLLNAADEYIKTIMI